MFPRRNSRPVALVVGATAAALASVVAIAGGAAVANTGHGSHRKVEFTTLSAGPTAVYPPFRSPEQLALCSPATGRCELTFVGSDRYSGDLEGLASNAGSLDVDSAFSGWAVSIAEFNGAVRGCPSAGTAAFRFTVRMGVNGKNVGTFEVIEGAGTGGLAELTGEGSFEATPGPRGIISSVGTATVRCDKN